MSNFAFKRKKKQLCNSSSLIQNKSGIYILYLSEYQSRSLPVMKGACVRRVFAKIKVNKTCNESTHNRSKHAYTQMQNTSPATWFPYRALFLLPFLLHSQHQGLQRCPSCLYISWDTDQLGDLVTALPQ